MTAPAPTIEDRLCDLYAHLLQAETLNKVISAGTDQMATTSDQWDADVVKKRAKHLDTIVDIQRDLLERALADWTKLQELLPEGVDDVLAAVTVKAADGVLP